MRKNQKYSKEEMYLAIELWQESGLSQIKFCSREKLSVKTFSYWYKKYKKENRLSVEQNKETPDAFIPVKVSSDRTTAAGKESYGRIELSFPNGVQLSCPAGIDIGQLKSLINL
ncbi:hypothetical protein GM418_02335 [Maribellus comscasis]|uniref:Transposase n=1 Tax=Maribellus comscasis TaxID=2681766 RepID=A0A6I6JQN9_9BACT|nr:hypothetical protein [Maribellus comscasis]QGY42532.1 hypothetical protein GM418_02335 [Maribellus comscasis]